ncbi:hypothetical protein L1987_08591 [Smallanthus sonchifolius]|uniref:Uncharacterized protein n=1 Tax=Smallanthus sonchifolius TaxID=185202 RepID=A0ACB9JMR8_9ASTR|nr:hypothetical protein L1987_08591 [Smallanthus sonchifolius]
MIMILKRFVSSTIRVKAHGTQAEETRKQIAKDVGKTLQATFPYFMDEMQATLKTLFDGEMAKFREETEKFVIKEKDEHDGDMNVGTRLKTEDVEAFGYTAILVDDTSNAA